jgi:hypothetical protein
LIVGAVAGWVWGVLAYSVPVPAVVLVMLAGFVLYLWRRAALPKRAVQTERTAQIAVAEPAPLTDNEIIVVRLLARADGECVTPLQLAARAALSNLVMDQTLERLVNRKFLAPMFNRMHQRAYHLCPAGRDYAIAAGYVRTPIAASVPRPVR